MEQSCGVSDFRGPLLVLFHDGHVAGGLTISGGTFTGSSGEVDVTNVILSSGTLTAPSGAFNVSGNWTNNGGTFTPGQGTVTFNGTGDQAINGTAASQTFYNFIIAKNAGTTLSVGGNTVTLTVSAFTETSGNFTAPPTLNLYGNVTLTAGTFTAGANINVYAGDNGSWTNNGGTFIPGSGTVTFISSGGMDPFYIEGTASAQTFNNITINVGTAVIARDMTTLNLNGTLTLTAGGVFFNNTITNINGDLINNGGSFNQGSDIVNITGNVVLNAGTFTAGSSNINVGGNWTNNGGTFTPGQGTVTFNGASNQTITPGGSSFYNLTVNKTSGYVSLTDNTTVSNNLDIANGTLDKNGNTLTVGGFSTYSYSLSNATQAASILFTNYLTIARAGTFTPDTSSFTAVNVTLSAGTLDISTGANTMTSTGTITLNGGNLIATNGNITAYNITINLGSFTVPGPGKTFNVIGNLSLCGGILNLGSANISIAGSFIITGGSISAGTSTITMTGSCFFNGAVNAIAYDSNHNILYAGGDFTTAGGTTVNYIAKWNGSSWSALGTGVNAPVRALLYDSDNNILYAGGDFTTAGGTTVNHIAMWNGSSWSALIDMNTGVTGVSGPVYALCYLGGGAVIVGGDFITASIYTVNNIAFWNGPDTPLWGPLGTGDGVNGPVTAIAYDGNNYLYAGGDFTASGSGSITLNYIARFDLSAYDVWSAVGTGVNAPVRALATDGSGNVYAGGDFTTAGGATVNYIAKWNGSSWSALASGGQTGVNASVRAVAYDSNYVYAGGDFTDQVAAYHGGSWERLSTSPLTFTLTTDGQSLSNLNINLPSLATVVLGSDLTLTGGITITAGTLDVSASNYNINLAGDWTDNGTFIPETGTVTFNGSGVQTVTPGSSSFYHLIIDKTLGLVILGGNTTVNSLTITNGTLDKFGKTLTGSATYSYSLSGTSVVLFTNYLTIDHASGSFTPDTAFSVINITLTSGTLDDSGSKSISVSGNWTNNGGTFSPGTGTVNYSGADQTVVPVNYYNLTLSGSGTKTLAGDINVAGNLDIEAGVTFNATSGNVTMPTGSSITNLGSLTFYDLTITGNWTANNGFTVSHIFTATTPGSTLIFTQGKVYDLQFIDLDAHLGTQIVMRSSGGAGTSYIFTVAQSGQIANNINVQGADNHLGQPIGTTNCTDSGDNQNWSFVGDLDHFIVDQITNVVTGNSSNVSVTAYDAAGHVKANYVGTIHFTSTDPLASLPADYTFTSGDAGTKTFTNGVTLKTVGTQSVTATDLVTGKSGTQSGIKVFAVNTAIWTGTSSGNWNTAGNWDIGSVPGSGYNIIIPSGTTNSPTLSGSVNMNSLNLNNTLNLGSYHLTVSNNITGSGTISGVSPAVSAGGYIGTLGNPIHTSITGTLSIGAGSSSDYTSVALSGSGSYNFIEPIPGFVFVNGSLQNQVGQNSFRQSLTQGDSPLYKGIGNFVAPGITTPLFMPLAVAAGPVPMAAVMPAPSFTGAMPGTVLPAKPSFEEALPKAVLPPAVSFEGAKPEAVLQPKPSFGETAVSLFMPEALPKPSFEGVTISVTMEEPITFSGAYVNENMPGALSKPSFEGATSSVIMLPQTQLGSNLIFEDVSSEVSIKVMLPSGQKIIPINGLGIPLGSEEYFLQPKIKGEEKIEGKKK